jgi:HK97 family phage major capsid protein
MRVRDYLNEVTEMELDDIARSVKSELARIGTDNERFIKAQKERHGEFETKQLELQARLLDLEQRAARRGGSGDDGYSDGGGHALRALLEGSAELKAVADRKARRCVLEMPEGFFSPQAAITSTGIAMPDQQPGIVGPVTRRLTIRSLIPSLPTDSGAVQYLQETGFTNAAAPVSEADVKPESNLTFELKSAATVVLAHWIRITAQALSDIPTLMQYIDTRLRYGLAYTEDLQLLSGSGVGNNLTGLKVAATAYNRNTSGDSKADELRRAISQLQDTEYTATGIVLHPFDLEEIALTKESGTGAYVMGMAGGAAPTSLWGVPIVATSAITAGDWLVGDFAQAALIFDRMEARVDISTESENDFTTNRAHVRAEERLALAILRPGALITGDFAAS